MDIKITRLTIIIIHVGYRSISVLFNGMLNLIVIDGINNINILKIKIMYKNLKTSIYNCVK